MPRVVAPCDRGSRPLSRSAASWRGSKRALRWPSTEPRGGSLRRPEPCEASTDKSPDRSPTRVDWVHCKATLRARVPWTIATLHISCDEVLALPRPTRSYKNSVVRNTKRHQVRAGDLDPGSEGSVSREDD